MNIKEAIEFVSNNSPAAWFRPVSWKGSGQAFTVKDNKTYLVPSLNGGILDMTFYVDDLIEEWETINPSEVLQERQ